MMNIFNSLEEMEGFTEVDELFCQQYTEQLASYNLSKLVSEPEHLKEERDNLLDQTQKLAFENYQTFIQAAECSKEVFKDFKIVEDHLDSVSQSLPMFAEKIEAFSKLSQEINSCRKQNSMVLTRHTQLLEILEIPQLMDTCVRNGHYEEALELANYVRRLEKKFPSIKIISDIGKEVKGSMQFMLNQLLQQLKDNIQLPACLRIISYIRQLDVFTEPELRLMFLEARGSWYNSVISQISTEDAYTHLSKIIEANRVHLFDIITQYRALFADDEPSYGHEKQYNFSDILHSWILSKIRDFMHILHEDIQNGAGERLESIFGQCMYFGLSFSRIGADFRAIFISVFHQYALRKFKLEVARATKRFENIIGTYRPSVKSYDRVPRLDNKKGSVDLLSPPQELLQYPPLALYLNGILQALNNLRQYAALSFVYKVRDVLAGSLEKCVSAIEQWARLESSSQPDGETNMVNDFCTVVLSSLVPFVKQAFEAFFTHDAVEEMIGRLPTNVSPSETKLSYTLDVGKFQEILRKYVDSQEFLEGMMNNDANNDVPVTTNDMEDEQHSVT